MTTSPPHPHIAAKHDRAQKAWTLIIRAGYALSLTETARLTGASVSSVTFMRRHLRSLRAAGVTPSGNWAEDRGDCWEVTRPAHERRASKAAA